MNPLVTVAIPTCDRLPLLRESLRDALGQDYANLEILVSDNGSTDGTRAMVEAMAQEEPRVRYRRNHTRVPVSTHFNQCLAEAKGEFFVLLCDDDRISLNLVRVLAEALLQNRRATLAVPTNAILAPDGSLTRTLPPPASCTCEGVDFVVDWLWKVPDLPVANVVTVMARTESVRKWGYHSFAQGFHSDNLLFLQLALDGQVSFCPEAIFFWRCHPSQEHQTATPPLVDQAGRQFRFLVRNDPRLRRLILSHHPARQKKLRRGVERMTAETYLHRIHFSDHPWRPETVKNLLACHFDATLFAIVFLSYLRAARQRLFPPPFPRNKQRK